MLSQYLAPRRESPRGDSPRDSRRWRTLAAGSVVAVAATGLVGVSAGPASGGSISGTLYRDPTTQVARWVSQNPSDPRRARIDSVINSQAQARWLSQVNVNTVQSDVAAYVGAANNLGQIPQLVVYGMPNRDCGGPSAGGAANFSVWHEWITNLSAGLGNRLVLVFMEPDAVALTDCLSPAGVTERFTALSRAVATIKQRNPQAKVYLDAGHSAWHSAATIAGRLSSAGVQQADGFYTNPSNYRRTEAEAAYGQQILAALGNPSNLRQVIDTSRNGNGPSPVNPQPNGWADWCDYQNARVGRAPTTNTGYTHVDAFVWIKPPGEADGCAASPGTFLPDYAYRMAEGVTPPPTTSSPPPSASGSSSASASQSSSSSGSVPPAGGCTVRYDLASSWSSGFVANVTVVNNGATAVNGWTLGLTYAGSEAVTNIWNAVASRTGNRIDARDVGHNAVIAARGGTQSFGFQGTHSGTTADPVSAVLNGTACTVI